MCMYTGVPGGTDFSNHLDVAAILCENSDVLTKPIMLNERRALQGKIVEERQRLWYCAAITMMSS